MFARVTIAQVKRETLDEAIQLYKEVILPGAKSQQGFRGAYLLTDQKTGKIIVFSLWDSEKDATDREQTTEYRETHKDIGQFITAPPIREGYEVSAQG